MKKALKFSGLVAALFAILSFILMMVTPAITIKGITGGVQELAGTAAIFGKSSDLTIGEAAYYANGDLVIPASWSAIIAWILVMVSMVILLLGVILPILKIKALDKFAGLLNLVAVCALVVAGIFMFIELGVFLALIDRSDASGYALGAGWVIAGILAILGGCVALLPAIADFMGGKKKKRK